MDWIIQVLMVFSLSWLVLAIGITLILGIMLIFCASCYEANLPEIDPGPPPTRKRPDSVN